MISMSSSCCGHEHAHTHNEQSNLKLLLIRLIAALLILFLAALEFFAPPFSLWLFAIAYLLAGYEVLKFAIQGIFNRELFNENFLMTIASLGAFALGDMSEAVAVMIFFGVGELLQGLAVQRSRQNISQLMDIRPDYANLKINGETKTVAPDQVGIGDIILVKPGEKIPLDGHILSGDSFIDTRALTGESVPRRATIGSIVYAGTINSTALLEIKVSKLFAESTVSTILRLVESAQDKKSPSEKFITKFARYYTPAVVGVASLVAIIPPLLGLGEFSVWLYRALTFLIVSCPCALVVAIPVSFFGGIGGAASHGVLIKGGNYLEALNSVDTIVFDKTGTLTQGVFEVVKVSAQLGFTEQEVLRLAASAEVHSTHPIALALVSANKQPLEKLLHVIEHAGGGVQAQTQSLTIHAGNARLLATLNIIDLPQFNNTTVYLAVNGQFAGYIIIADRIKPGVERSLQELRNLGIKNLRMLTGDNEQVAKELANTLKIDYRAELLPQEKVEALEVIMQQNPSGKVAFVGDGINDAPVIMRADIGIAMGGIGSDAAIEAADVVIMNDDISKISTALKVAYKTRRIVKQNIVFALGVKLGVMLLAFVGHTSMWAAIFADVGVALLAIANAVRAMHLDES